MPLLKTSFISKIILFLVAAMLSVSVIASDFNKYQGSANQGDAGAKFNLGIIYENAEGVPRDYSKAFEWYLKSANQGFSRAQYNLGGMYSDGKGVRQDYTKSVD